MSSISITIARHLKAVAVPFISTRILLIIVGLVTPLFLSLNTSLAPANLVEEGTWFVPTRIVDMWVRWDSGWYLSVAQSGYQMGENVRVESNLAFFPVYPLLISLVQYPIPMENTIAVALAGLLVAQVAFFTALVVVHAFVQRITKDKDLANATIWFVAVFPSSFFLSSVYSESTFLLLSALSLWWAVTKRWWLAGIAGSLLGATRLVGLAILIPLVWIYLDQIQWNLSKVTTQAAWLAVVPLGILAFFSHLYDVTGSFFAALSVQEAWGRNLANPLQSFFTPTGYWLGITQLDQLAIAAVVLAAVWLVVCKPFRYAAPLALYSLALITPTLTTGTLDSSTRFAGVIIPFFMAGAVVLQHKKTSRWLVYTGCLLVQLLLFARFTQFYWVG